jgi:Tol biopolymer transport system component
VQHGSSLGPWHRLFRVLSLSLGAGLLSAQTCTQDNLSQKPATVQTFRVSLGTDFKEGNGDSDHPSISADGRFVAFASLANNLALPPSHFKEIFIRDRWTDTVENITQLTNNPEPGNVADCDNPYISPNGRYVVFESKGPLIWTTTPQPAQTTLNLFVYDRVQKVFVQVFNSTSPDTGPPQFPNRDVHVGSIADDGIHVACLTRATNIPGVTLSGNNDEVLVADITNSYPSVGGATTWTLVSRDMTVATSEANNSCSFPMISRDASSVVFTSPATNLNAAATNAHGQIFLGTPAGAACELISQTTAGVQLNQPNDGATVSSDGQFVSFLSGDTTLVPGYTPGAGIGGAFGTGNGFLVVVRDRTAKTTTVVAKDGIIIFSAIDRMTMSDDARFYAYISLSDGQLHLTDRVAGTNIPISVGPSGTPGDIITLPLNPSMTPDGMWVVYQDKSDNLVAGDTNGAMDIFGYGPTH